jgi:hypothetical protein
MEKCPIESVGNAQFGSFRDGKVGNILPIPADLAARGLVNAHNGTGQAGLAAAVGAGDYNKFFVLYSQGDIL